MDLARLTATELTAALRARRVSSRELLDAYIARIERLNPLVNAVVTLDLDGARAAAARADEATARGEWPGPLHGLPVTVKDALDTAGMRTTGGAAEFEGRVPTADAPAVARLRAAGAIVFAKTNLPRWSGDLQTWNTLFGATCNPWDLARAPGGSSGGAAVAMACGLSALETGTDIGGSIRNPAHFTGVYGHKPSFGLVPGRGYFDRPGGGHFDVDVNVVGPLARSVDDLELAMHVMAGWDTLTARRPGLTMVPPRAGELADYRVALWLDHPDLLVDAPVRDAIAAAADRLADAGVAVTEDRPAIDVVEVLRTYYFLLGAAMGTGDPATVELGRSLRTAPAGPDEPVNLSFARGAAAEMVDWLAACAEREAIRRQWARFFEHYDALACPVVPTTALPNQPGVAFTDRVVVVNGVEHPAGVSIAWCGLMGVACLPVTVVPVGQDGAGLPVGVQVVGPFLEDRTCLDLARRMDAVLGAYRVPSLAMEV